MVAYALLILLTVISVGLAEGEEVNVSCDCMKFILPYLPSSLFIMFHLRVFCLSLNRELFPLLSTVFCLDWG